MVTTFMEFLGHRKYGGATFLNAILSKEIAVSMQKTKVNRYRVVDNEADYLKFVDAYNGGAQIYVGLNPVRNNLKRHSKDADVIVWCNEVIDLDLKKPKQIDEDVPERYPKGGKYYAACEDDLKKLEPSIDKINTWFTDRGFKTGYQDRTGNGYRWILPVPGFDLTGHNSEALEALAAKKKEFIAQIARECGIVDGCGAHLDSVFDFRRITGVPRTLNFKLETETRKNRVREPFRGAERDEDDALRDYILNIDVSKPEPHDGERTQAPCRSEGLEYWLTRDPKLKRLYEGDTSGYPSRSEAEQALANKLVFYNFSESEIEDILLSAGIGKAAEEKKRGHTEYIERTTKKAFEFTRERVQEKKTAPEPKTTGDGTVYAIEEGCFVKYTYKKVIDRKSKEVTWEPMKTVLCNFVVDLQTDTLSSDGITSERWWEGEILVNSHRIPFKDEARKFITPADHGKVLATAGGSALVFENRNLQDIRHAMQEISTPKCRNVRQTFGLRDTYTYETPSVMIDRDGVHPTKTGDIDLSGKGNAKHLDMQVLTDAEFRAVGAHIRDDLLHLHTPYVINSLTGFTFLAPFNTEITCTRGWTGENVGLVLIGTTGENKTFNATMYQWFFGDFSQKGAITSWTATPNEIQVVGYYFKDAVFLVDDFKLSHFRGNPSRYASAIGILQNYPDGTARDRLTSEIKIREGQPIRGALIATGEDFPHNEASLEGRYHIIYTSGGATNREVGGRCLRNRHRYSGFMARYIAWVFQKDEYAADIVHRIDMHRDIFIAGRETETNIDRLAQSFAYNLAGFELFCHFMGDCGFVYPETAQTMIEAHKTELNANINIAVDAVRDATASATFLRILSELIVSGRFKIHDWGDWHTVSNPDYDPRNPDSEERISEPLPLKDLPYCIGFDEQSDDPYLYIIPGLAFAEVCRVAAMQGMPFPHTQTGTGKELISVGGMT